MLSRVGPYIRYYVFQHRAALRYFCAIETYPDVRCHPSKQRLDWKSNPRPPDHYRYQAALPFCCAGVGEESGSDDQGSGGDGGSGGGARPRLNQRRAVRERRYHTADTIHDLNPSRSVATDIHKRLSLNYNTNTNNNNTDATTTTTLLLHPADCVSCESLASSSGVSFNPSSSGVSSTASLYRAGCDDEWSSTGGPPGDTVQETTTSIDTITDDVQRQQPSVLPQDDVDERRTQQRVPGMTSV